MTNRKVREHDLHVKLAHEYDERREGTRNGRYYSKEWLRHLVRLMNIPKRAKLLDIGCGTGILFEVLQEEGFTDLQYVGTDLSEDMLAVGKKRYPGIDLRTMDCENLEFKNRSFDVVFMRSVLHHVPNPSKAIMEMARVSKKIVLIAEPLRNILTEFPRYLSKKLTDHFDEDHTHYSIKDLKRLLKKGRVKDYELFNFGYVAYPFGFTDILPGAKYLPLFLLKGMFKFDVLMSKVPLLRRFSWHVIALCNVKKK